MSNKTKSTYLVVYKVRCEAEIEANSPSEAEQIISDNLNVEIQSPASLYESFDYDDIEFIETQENT